MTQPRPSGLFGKMRIPMNGLPEYSTPGSSIGGDNQRERGRLGDEGMFQPSGPHVSASGFPTLQPYSPDAPNRMPNANPNKSLGVFGSQPSEPQLPDSGDGQPAWSASAMGAPLDGSHLPRHQFTQPFDYDATLAALMPKPEKHSTLRDIARIAVPALMGLAGNQAGANAFIANERESRDQRDKQTRDAQTMAARWKYQDHSRQMGADLRASSPFTIGRDRLQYDPQSGSVDTLYDGQEPFEEYASTMGYEPGTPEYFKAAEDYVMRGEGPSAFDRKTALDDHRTANDRSLEGYRYGNRVGLEGVRQGNRMGLEGVHQANRVGLEGVRQSDRMTTRQTPTYHDTHSRGGHSSARPTATGPNGKKVEWNGSAWVPAN